MKRYRTIVADPPWQVDQHLPGQAHERTGRRLPPYGVVTIGEIERLPVSQMAADDAHLYVWTINAYIEETYRVVRGWGFTPKTLLTWVKAPMGLGLGGAFSQTSEHILFARRGRDVAQNRADTTWWQWPRGRHSAKPDAFQDIVEQVSPGPYLELFARRDRLGWDTWGNESLQTAEMAVA